VGSGNAEVGILNSEAEGIAHGARGKKEGAKIAAIRLVLTFTFNLYPLSLLPTPLIRRLCIAGGLSPFRDYNQLKISNNEYRMSN